MNVHFEVPHSAAGDGRGQAVRSHREVPGGEGDLSLAPRAGLLRRAVGARQGPVRRGALRVEPAAERVLTPKGLVL